MPRAIPEFGRRIAGRHYRRRPGAYAVILDAECRIAVVRTSNGRGAGVFFEAAFGAIGQVAVEADHTLVWLTPTEAEAVLSTRSHAWAVRHLPEGRI